MAQWSFLQDSPRLAHIYGTRGRITMERMHCPEKLTISRSGDAEVQVQLASSDRRHRSLCELRL